MKLNELSGYVDIEIIKLLTVSDNLNQKTITQKLDKINKSSISRSLKKLSEKDVIRKQLDGTYSYRFSHLFKNPDRVLYDLIPKLLEVGKDVRIDNDGNISLVSSDDPAVVIGEPDEDGNELIVYCEDDEGFNPFSKW